MKVRKTKIDMILEALKAGDRMTHLKALACGTHRLAAHIYELRKKGYVIDVAYKRDGNGYEYAEYSLPRS